MAEITEVKLNAVYCAVLCGGQVMLHSVCLVYFLVEILLNNCMLRLKLRHPHPRTNNSHNCFQIIFMECRRRWLRA